MARQLCAKLGAPCTQPATQSHSLLLSAGGSSSSMYSRFRCSSRSASCSFCLRAGDRQQQAELWAHFSSPSGGHSLPSQPEVSLQTSLPDPKPGGYVRWPHHLLSHQSPNPPQPSSGDPWTSPPICPLLPIPQPTHWSRHHHPFPAPSTLNPSGPFSTQQPGIFLECKSFIKRKEMWDFPGGTVVKNPPANAGDTGSSPGPGRSHMPQSN